MPEETFEELEMLKEDGQFIAEEALTEQAEKPGNDPEKEPESDDKELEDKKPEEGDEVTGEAPDEYFTKNFEGFESIDQVKQLAERGKLFSNEVETEVNTLRQGSTEAAALKKENAELKNRQPFQNSKYYQLDKLTQDAPESASVLQRFMFGNPSDQELVKLGMLFDNPEVFNENPEAMERKFQRNFPALAKVASGEMEKDDPDYQDALIDISIEAKSVKKRFDTEIAKVEVPKIKTEEEVKEEQVAFAKTWKGSIGAVQKELTMLNIDVLDEKDEKKTVPFMEYEIPKEDQKFLLQEAVQYILTTKPEAGEESVKAVLDIVKTMYFIRNQAKILTEMGNKIASKQGAKWRKRVNNSKQVNKETTHPEKEDGKMELGTADYAYKESMKGFEGV